MPACNAKLGTEVEGHFLRDDWLIAEVRALLGIGHPRKGRRGDPPNPKHRAQLKDGTPIEIDMRDGSWVPKQRHPVVTRDGDKVTISAATEEEGRAALEDLLRKLDRDGVSHSEPETVKQQIENPEIEVKVQVNPTLWLRVMAKITLAAVSTVLPDSWLDSPNAQQLQGWLWDDEPKFFDGSPAEAPPRHVDAAFAMACPPPEHLLCLKRTTDPETGALAIVLFGTWQVLVPVEGRGTPLPEVAWRLDPIAGSVEKTTFDQLVQQTSLRVVKAMEEAERATRRE